MKTKLLLAAAAATLIAVPAMAQVAGAAGLKAGVSSPAAGATAGTAIGAQTNLPAATPPVDTSAVNPPATSATAAGAATGAATNTSATEADLTVGAPVTDSTGAPIGTISKVSKGKTSVETSVTLSAGGKTAKLPASSLSLSGGNLISTQTKASIWGQK